MYLMHDSKQNTHKKPCQILTFKCLIHGNRIGITLDHAVISKTQHMWYLLKNCQKIILSELSGIVFPKLSPGNCHRYSHWNTFDANPVIKLRNAEVKEKLLRRCENWVSCRCKQKFITKGSVDSARIKASVNQKEKYGEDQRICQ